MANSNSFADLARASTNEALQYGRESHTQVLPVPSVQPRFARTRVAVRDTTQARSFKPGIAVTNHVQHIKRNALKTVRSSRAKHSLNSPLQQRPAPKCHTQGPQLIGDNLIFGAMIQVGNGAF